MPIVAIKELENKNIKTSKPIKEVMDIYIPDIPDGISRRNGMIYLLVGSGGSGKTSLLLNQFKKGGAYRGAYHKKFHNLYYFCPSSSFSSVEKHPFEKHDKVYHALDMEVLSDLKKELSNIKKESIENDQQQYNCVIIDDFANDLKDKGIQQQLNSMLIKARHLNTSFIFTLQSYIFMPRTLRKQITFLTCFRPRNSEEWDLIRKEILQMKDQDAKIIFDYCFDKPYQHLDVDAFENKYYKNFNLLEIDNKNDIK